MIRNLGQIVSDVLRIYIPDEVLNAFTSKEVSNEIIHDEAYGADNKMCTCIHCGKMMRIYFRCVEIAKKNLEKKHLDNFKRLYGTDYAYDTCAVVFCQGCDIVWKKNYEDKSLKQEKKLILLGGDMSVCKFILDSFEYRNKSFDELVNELEVSKDSMSCFLDKTWALGALGKDGFGSELDCLFLPGCTDNYEIDIKKQFFGICDAYESKLVGAKHYLASWRPKYMKFNFSIRSEKREKSLLGRVLVHMREVFTERTKYVYRDILDLKRSTLLLVGFPNTCTEMHLDIIEAINLAIAIFESDVNTPLAIWWFISPRYVLRFVEFLARNYKVKKENTKSGVREATIKDCPGNENFDTWFKEFQEETKAPDSDVFVKEQRHNEVFHVLPGFLHCVRNVKPNVKLAWDFYDYNNLPFYASNWRFHSQHGVFVNDDYSGFENVLLFLANEIFTCVKGVSGHDSTLSSLLSLLEQSENYVQTANSKSA